MSNVTKKSNKPNIIHSEYLELKKVNNIFKTFMNVTTDGLLVVDENCHITEINSAYCRFLGLNKESILGKHVLEVIPNSELPRIIARNETDIDVIHRLAEGQSPNKEKAVAVTRTPVIDDHTVIGAVAQIKFSKETKALADRLGDIESELEYYKKELHRLVGTKYTFENMIGIDENFNSVKKIAMKAAKNDFNVLILGETGTGKEVIANALHFASSRRNKPFIRINCAAIPFELLESELFGYEEGAFTGAKKGGKIGKFELANQGTIFLDEIGELPLNMQSKLLRVLQEKEIEKIGSENTIPLNVRVIAATNQNLEEKVQNKAFRSDLFYRLNVIQIKLPPLRERSEDIPFFIESFLSELNSKYEANVTLSPETKAILNRYKYPGNIRELKNIIERAFSQRDGDVILPTHLPVNLISRSQLSIPINKEKTLDAFMADIEREIILDVLAKNNFNCQSTAKNLGIHRSTLYKKMEKLNIPLPR